MKLIERLNRLNGTECLVLSAPTIECAMTAVVDARINRDGIIKLTYSDGTEEKAKANKQILSKDVDNQSLLEWVSCVQFQRAEAEKDTDDLPVGYALDKSKIMMTWPIPRSSGERGRGE